uniref:Uncharacterized protein n=1 Tax=Cacopsylla melanoneura TaxID=428564 RepID=A0A8D8R9B8_9HEMI
MSLKNVHEKSYGRFSEITSILNDFHCLEGCKEMRKVRESFLNIGQYLILCKQKIKKQASSFLSYQITFKMNTTPESPEVAANVIMFLENSMSLHYETSHTKPTLVNHL